MRSRGTLLHLFPAPRSGPVRSRADWISYRVAGRAGLIVSGNRVPPDLGLIRGVSIVDPAEALKRVLERRPRQPLVPRNRRDV